MSRGPRGNYRRSERPRGNPDGDAATLGPDDSPQHDIRHIYIRDAVKLRPDLSKLPPVNWDELERWIGEQMQEHERG